MGLQHVGTKLGLANGASWHEKAMTINIGQADTLTR
jgi:hypothetical protein